MRKFQIRWLMIVTVAIMSIGITSCTKDDGGNDRLVGSWSCNNHYYGGSYGGVDTYTFKSNGTYEWSCTGDWWSDESGRYDYNEENGLLVITNQKGTSWVYFVSFISNNSFMLIDEEGVDYIYYRSN